MLEAVWPTKPSFLTNTELSTVSCYVKPVLFIAVVLDFESERFDQMPWFLKILINHWLSKQR